MKQSILHLILSPGKSGTQSLEAFLKNMFPDEEIIRLHWISDEACVFFKNIYRKSKDQSLKTQISLAEKTKKNIAKKKYNKIIIYWSCRNPYNTAISSIFQNFDRYRSEFRKNKFMGLSRAADFTCLIKTLLKDEMPSSERFKKYVFAKEFFEKEICFIVPWAKKITPKLGVFRSTNEDIYILPLEKQLRYLYKLSGIEWLNPDYWPKNNITQVKKHGKLYLNVKTEVKFPREWIKIIEKISWYKN